MRILLINANTSEVVTAKVLAGAKLAASMETELVAVTGTFGAEVIASRAGNAIGEHSTVALAEKHGPGCDGVVIAVSYDTGLRAARELLKAPVVGITEASLLTACMLGGRIGVITFGARVRPLYEELVASYGLSDRVGAWRTLESTAAYKPGHDAALEAMLAGAANELVAADRVETVILTGAVMAGVAARLQPRVSVPILDGVTCGVRMAEMLARSGYPKPTTGSYA